MSRTERLLEEMLTLQTKDRFTVQEMADEFAVSRRTMLRDLQALSEMGVPLAAQPGPAGGYRLIRERRLLPLSLTPDEAIGLVLSYEAFLQYAQSPFTAQSLSAVTKLRNAMPADLIRDLDRVHEHVAVAEPVRSYSAPWLAEVLQAALDGVHLRLVYESMAQTSERLVFPYGLFASEGFWYCPCYDHRRAHSIFLRVDRIRSLQREGGLERPEAALTLREWLATYRRDPVPMVRVVATVTDRGAKSFDLSVLFGEIELNEGGQGTFEADIPVSEIEWFAAHLLPLGTDIVIHAPLELRDAIHRKSQAVAALYETCT
jgi:predicted DNA-binding transcriptional regulator YafY